MRKLMQLALSVIAIASFVAWPARADACHPLSKTDRAAIDKIKAALKVPPDVAVELVDVETIPGSCQQRLLFEALEPNRIRELMIYLSADGRFLSHDLGDISGSWSPNAGTVADAGGAPARGSAVAPVTIVEFSDFQCPFCRSAAKTLEQIVQSNPNVRVVFRNFPLPMHPWALAAARAASCSRRTPEAFWKLHDYYFDHQRELTLDNIADKTRTFLTSLDGMDMAAFDRCVASEESLQQIRADMRTGIKRGISGTPSVFVNDRQVKLGGSNDDLVRQIEEITGVALKHSAVTTYLVYVDRAAGADPALRQARASLLRELSGSGKLVSAGTIAASPGTTRDVLVLRAGGESEVREILGHDPAVEKGQARIVEIHAWSPAEGTEPVVAEVKQASVK
jgi:protein-disulfide isomerase